MKRSDQAAKWIPKVIDTSITLAKSGSTPLAYLPLIGTAIDVSLRLKGKDENLRGITPENKVAFGTRFIALNSSTTL